MVHNSHGKTRNQITRHKSVLAGPRARVLTVTVFFIIALAIGSYQSLLTTRTIYSQGLVSYEKMEIFNVDGDLSLPEDQHWFYWNPHMEGSPNATWNVTFTDECAMWVKNIANEEGRIVVGPHYKRAFIPAGYRAPVERSIFVEMDVLLEVANYAPGEWLRIAISNELYVPYNLSTKILELDFWDSPNTYTGPARGVVFSHSNITAIHLDQIPQGVWTYIRFNITDEIKNLWGNENFPWHEKQFFLLSASNIIIEYNSAVLEAKLHVKNLILSREMKPKLPTLFDEASVLDYVRAFMPADVPVVEAPENPPNLTNRLPQVKMDGKQLLANNLPIVLKGGGDDYGSIMKNYWIFEEIAKYPNFSCVRLSFRMITSRDSFFWSNIDFQELDKLLVVLEAKGIYAILDCHHDWLPLIYEELWIRQWVEIASYYSNSTVVAAYELCNEPRFDYGIWLQKWLGWEPVDWKTNGTALAYMRATETIRSVDTMHPLVFNIGYVSPQMLPPLLNTSGAIMTFHAWTKAESIEEAQNLASYYSERLTTVQELYDIPFYLGEYGIYWRMNITVQDFWFRYWTDIAKSMNWEYTFWELLDSHYLEAGYWDLMFL